MAVGAFLQPPGGVVRQAVEQGGLEPFAALDAGHGLAGRFVLPAGSNWTLRKSISAVSAASVTSIRWPIGMAQSSVSSHSVRRASSSAGSALPVVPG